MHKLREIVSRNVFSQMSLQVCTVTTVESVLCGILVSLVIAPITVFAAELKVLDTSGLVRGAKVVQDDGKVTVDFTQPPHAETVCVLKNVDGLAPDRTASPAGTTKCLFSKVPAGSWQLSVSTNGKWQVHVSGE